jgi:hypothetical protein
MEQVVNESDGDAVWLTVGPEYDEGEFISRMRLPDDAIRSALEADGSKLDGGEARMYEVWTIER